MPDTLYENLNTITLKDYAGYIQFESQANYQTFTPSISHSITSVKLAISNYDGYTSGDITVEIRAVDAGHLPTGSALATCTLVGEDIIPTEYAVDMPLTEFVFAVPTDLSAGTEYAICVFANDSDAYLWWSILAASEGNYASGLGGYGVYSTGWDWVVGEGTGDLFDLFFEEYGIFIVVNPTVTASSSPAAGGTLDPTGAVEVTYGADQLFTATASAGYRIYEWLVDDVLVQAGGATYLLENVTEDHTVKVKFSAHAAIPTTWNPDRPGVEDKTKSWDEETQTWVTATGNGGSRYRDTMLVFTKDTNHDGKILVGR